MATIIEQVLEGTATSAQQRTYISLPFDVPENVSRIAVRYSYSKQVGSDPQFTDGNTVDIGIFDARGAGFLSEGFRGWSGSARDSFFVGRDKATPGYMPGPIMPGTWWIALGLYKICDDGCHFTVTIALTVEDVAAPAVDFPSLLPLRSQSPARVPAPNGWYKGELHCHSEHSDGDSSVTEIIQLAQSLVLDFLAITDHNNITQLAALNTEDTPLMLIPGYEVTNYNGHWNVWGGQGWIDFRIETAEQMEAAMQQARRRGFLVSSNHPRPLGPEWVFENVEAYDCIEVWNGPWPFLNSHCLSFWEQRLNQGKRFVAVGGSDNHFLKREHGAKLGYPTNYVYCEGDPSPATILQAIRQGHNFITESPDGPQLYMKSGNAMMGDTVPSGTNTLTVRVVDGGGTQLELHSDRGIEQTCAVEADDCQFEIGLEAARRLYVRAQLVDPADEDRRVRALTNPIYFAQAD